jgi:molybdopterin molybdotransferase
VISLDEARAIIRTAVVAGHPETVDLPAALGRTLAEPVVAAWSLPPYDNSAVDGFALRHADLKDTPLELAGSAYAGQQTPTVSPGKAVRITTGARVPPELDTVIPQERARVDDNRVRLEPGANKGANVRLAGEDATKGAELASAGTRVGPALVAALAAFGHAQVHVVRRPRVDVLTLGDELVPAARASSDSVVDANGPALVAHVADAGGHGRHLGLASDDPDQLRERLRNALSDCDVLVTVGGASVGDRDHVRRLLRELGVDFRFEGVKARPGKPAAFGVNGSTLVFALPGNPLAAAVTFHNLVRPAIFGWLGARLPAARKASLSAVVDKRAGYVEYVPTRLVDHDGRLEAQLAPRRGSGSLTSALGCDGYAVLPADREQLDQGELVDVELF